MSFEDAMDAVSSGASLQLATVSYAESVTALIAVGERRPDPTEDELAHARATLTDRKWLDEAGGPAGPLRVFARLMARPGCRTWFWDSSVGTALMTVALGRDVTGLAIPQAGPGDKFALSMQPLAELVDRIADDAWRTERTSLTAMDISGHLLPITLDRTEKKAKVTAPKSPGRLPASRGMRTRAPMRTSSVDRAGFAQLVTTALTNPLWGLDDENRALAQSLA